MGRVGISLEGIFVHHPFRLFKDNFSLSLINHWNSMIKPNGYLVLPYTSNQERIDGLLLDLPWLEKQLGRSIKNFPKQKLAAFRPLQEKIKVESVFDLAGSKLHGLLQHNNSGLNLDKKNRSTLSKFMVDSDICKIESSKAVGGNDWHDAQSLLSFSTYSIFGASYKTQSVNKFISEFLPSNKSLKVLDIGGGLGFVDVELLLSNRKIDKLINCEPTFNSVFFNKLLFEYFSQSISGRYSLRIEKIEDFVPDEKIDIVCDFASLLYVPRKKLVSTLRSLWAGLNKGGIFIIHENIKRPIFKEKPYYNMVFEAAELDKVLSEFGQIRYYRSSDFTEMPKNQTQDTTVFRVVKK